MSAIENKTEAQLVDEYTPLVISQALIFHPSGLSGIDDYIQCGYIGLLRAIRKYDPTKKAKLSTFAVICIRQEIFKELKKNQKIKCYNTLMDSEAKENEEGRLWELEPNTLNETETKVIRLRAQGYTFAEIGSRLGFTKSWANEVLLSAIKKIRVANANEEKTENPLVR